MTSGFVAVNDAFIDHAVDYRGGFIERRGGFRMFARLERQGGLTDGTAQLRSEGVVAGAVRRRLPGSFFSRFRIRQARHSLKEPRSLPIDPAVVNSQPGSAPEACYSGATELPET